jgi:hypothetical protein
LEPGQPIGHGERPDRGAGEHEHSDLILAGPGPVQHVAAVGGQGQLGKEADEAAPRLDEADHGARGRLQPLEETFPVEGHLAQEPVRPVLDEEPVVGFDGVGIALAADDQGSDLELVHPEMEEGIVELPGQPQWPGLGAGRGGPGGVDRRRPLGPEDGEGGGWS